MTSVKRYTWEIIPLGTPLFKKKCNKCNNSDFYYSSDKFRMNSQKRNLDIWLIYKCMNCDNTCNITIHSRTRPEQIHVDLFDKFNCNDRKTAWEYAFDPEVIRKNHMEVDYSQIEYDILGDCLSLNDISMMEEDVIEVELVTHVHFPLKLTSVLRKSLNLSLNVLERFAESGIIVSPHSKPLRKCKVQNGLVVTINRRMLHEYLSNPG